jgi:hypothetical protein
MGRMNDVIDTALSTLEAISPAVTIGGGVVNGGHLITRTFSDVIQSGSSFCAHVMNFVFMLCKYPCRSCLPATLNSTMDLFCMKKNLRVMGQTLSIGINV